MNYVKVLNLMRRIINPLMVICIVCCIFGSGYFLGKAYGIEYTSELYKEYIEQHIQDMGPVDDGNQEPETPIEEDEPETIEKKYYDVPLDNELQDFIFAECETDDIDPAIILAMIERESRYTADAAGDSGRSLGLMQIQPRWHADRMARLGVTDLLDPYQNVLVGIDLMKELMGHDKGIEWALMAYNGGPGYANRVSGEGRISEYAAGIITRSRELNAGLRRG